MTEFKSVERRIRFRTCNKSMPHRRIDIPAGAVDMCNPEFLSLPLKRARFFPAA